jgi:hypothetical protein
MREYAREHAANPPGLQLLRNGKGLLLDFDARGPFHALASRWNDRITYVASDAKDRLGLSAVLVRPDGFVAWADETASDYEGATLAASRWFGKPAAMHNSRLTITAGE